MKFLNVIIILSALVGLLMVAAPAFAQDYYIKRDKTGAQSAPEKNLYMPRGIKNSGNQSSVILNTKTQDAPLLSADPVYPESDSFDVLGKEDFKAMMAEGLGECSEQDKEIIGLVGQGEAEFNSGLDNFRETGALPKGYEWPEGFDLEEAKEEYEKTGQLPEGYVEMMSNQELKPAGIHGVLMEDGNMEAVMGAQARCMDMESVLGDVDIEKMMQEKMDEGIKKAVEAYKNQEKSSRIN